VGVGITLFFRNREGAQSPYSLATIHYHKVNDAQKGTEKLALLIREAKKTSFGAKITGAGGGGCIIALVDKSNLENTLSSLKAHSECFSAKIDFNGLVYT